MIAPVFALASQLRPVRTTADLHYPDLAVLRRSVVAGEWNAVAAYFERLPPRSDRSVAVRSVAGTAGSERFLQRVVDTERDSSLARTLLGARLVQVGWDARGARPAKYVNATRRQVFVESLRQAERLLADAVAIDATNAAAWTERITLARGLGVGPGEARRRYERAAEHCDVPYVAQVQLIQNLCPKWGGTMSAVHAFARECLTGSAPGTLGGSVVADAHLEQGFTSDRVDAVRDYLGQRKVRDDLVAAAAHTVLNPAFQPGHGAVGAHSAFACALFQGGWHASAAPHFAALGRRMQPYAWKQLHLAWRTEFLRARRAVRKS